MDSDSKYEIHEVDVFSTKEILYLNYIEPETLAKVTISLDQQGLKINRVSSESTTSIHCVTNHKTQASMRTPYGEQIFDVRTQDITTTEDSLTLQYELYSGDLLIQKAQVYYQFYEGGLN